GDVVEQRSLEDRMVVAIIQAGAAGEKIEVPAAAIVVHPRAFGPAELPRHRARVAADLRFHPVVDGEVRGLACRRRLQLGGHDRASLSDRSWPSGASSMLTSHSVSWAPAKCVSRMKSGVLLRLASRERAKPSKSAQEAA